MAKYLILLFIFLATPLLSAKPRAIVVFLADDLGYGDTSAYGLGAVPTPMVVAWPGHIKGGEESSALISHTDFARSLAKIIEVEVPMGACEDSEELSAAMLGERENLAELQINKLIELRDELKKLRAGE